jgi:hypothetical protein
MIHSTNNQQRLQPQTTQHEEAQCNAKTNETTLKKSETTTQNS